MRQVILVLLAAVVWCQGQICFEDIQRSAKNYWEYRVQVRDAENALVETRYNCRDRTMQINSTVLSLDTAGEGLCQRLYRH